jgi:hemerythrin
MSWDSSLSTGIDVVDFQHMQLVKSTEAFAEVCSNGASKDYVNKTLNFLEDYVVEHFSTEETLQRSCDYPRFAQHKRCHDYFIKDFTEVKDKIDEQGYSMEVMNELSSFLIDWIIDHIAQEDLTFGKYYKAQRPDLALTLA